MIETHRLLGNSIPWDTGFPLVFILFSALTNPENLGLLLTTDLGLMFFGGAMGLWALGLLWLKALLSAKVT